MEGRKKHKGYIRAKILTQSCILKINEADEETRARVITQMDKYLTDECDLNLFNSYLIKKLIHLK